MLSWLAPGRRRRWTLALGAAAWLGLAGAAQAATITVTRLDDPVGAGACPADCSLRQAVGFATAGDTIALGGTLAAPATYRLTQGNALLVSKSLTIDGGGAGATKIDGANNRDPQNRQDRILKATAGTLLISDLTFTGGLDGRDENFVSCSPCITLTANGGGALFNSGATVIVERVVFTANSGSPVGGAIGNTGTLTLTDVDFSANGAGFGAGLFSRNGDVTATRVTFRDAGGGFGGGAVYLRGGLLTMTNSTVLGNGSPSTIGGGIVNQAGTLILRSVTLSENLRGGLETHQGASTTVRNTILGTGFRDAGNGACSAAGRTTSAGTVTAKAVTTDEGNNLDEDGTCALTGPGDLSLVDARVAPAGNNGGETPTAALLFGSAALDAGNDTLCPLTDQRGISRQQGQHCDIGAFEAVRIAQPTATTDPAVEIGPYEAKLAATVNLSGEAGALRFEWGTSPTTMTETTLLQAAGVLSAGTALTQPFQGLNPLTTYYYRVVAENATSAYTGETRQFTTAAAPPSVYAVSVESVTDTTARIDFVIDPGGAETTYLIEYGAPAAGLQTTSVSIGSAPGPQELSRTLTGLSPGTRYTFDVVATNSTATSRADSGPFEFTTAARLAGSPGTAVTLSDSGNAGLCPSATIDWGDGTRADTSATVTCADDGFDGYDYHLTATHIYATTGRFRIQIDYDGGNRGEAWAEIVPAPPTETPPVVQPAPTATPTPTPTASPTPVFHQTVTVQPVSGKVLVKVKGSNRFVPLAAGRAIPLGSEVDVRKGRITLTSVPKAGGVPESAVFYDGMFIVAQVGDITELRLSEKLAPCKKASAAAVKKAKKRKLWGDGKGKFRTKGAYSAATVRGTRWLVEDTCAGTRTTVKTGVVAVRDDVLRKSIVLRAGGSYLARPKRR